MKREFIGGMAACLVVAALSATPTLSQATGDADNGADLFDSYCGECHSVSPKGLNKKGPTLYHIFGRRAGTSPGFKFSQPMVASGIVWTPDKISTYLANPKGVVPAGIMKFKGMPKPQDRADVIAYLRNPD